MSDFKPNPGSFLPLLEASQRRGLSGPRTQPAPSSPLTLLEILAEQSEPEPSLPLFELQKQGNMDPLRYGEALKSLRNAGYIAIEGDAPEQVVRLSDRGAEVVRLARPA